MIDHPAYLRTIKRLESSAEQQGGNKFEHQPWKPPEIASTFLKVPPPLIDNDETRELSSTTPDQSTLNVSIDHASEQLEQGEGTFDELFLERNVIPSASTNLSVPQGSEFDAIYQHHIDKIKERYSQPPSVSGQVPYAKMSPSGDIGIGIPMYGAEEVAKLGYETISILPKPQATEPRELDDYTHMVIHRIHDDRFLLIWAPDFYGATAPAFVGTRHMDRWLLWTPPETNKPCISPMEVEVNDAECKIHSTLKFLIGARSRRYALHLGGVVPQSQRSLLFNIYGAPLRMSPNPHGEVAAIDLNDIDGEEVFYWPGTANMASEGPSKKKPRQRKGRRSLMGITVHKRTYYTSLFITDGSGERGTTFPDGSKKKVARTYPTEARLANGERPDQTGSENHRIIELIGSDGEVVLYLTKCQEGSYRLDFTTIFTTFQAFGLALTQIESQKLIPKNKKRR